MPRPKSELTKSGKTIGIRVTQSEYEEYMKLGGGKWLRAFLKDSRFERGQNVRTDRLRLSINDGRAGVEKSA
jgi:hypothetical protein